jgi:Domain of unknown function (DUF4411)
MSKYLLDSNVFIQAHRMHYPFDVVPSFWDKLITLSDDDVIFSIDKVKKELYDYQNPDILGKWCHNDIKSNFFVDSSNCIDKYGLIANWAVTNNHHYKQAAIDEFLSPDLADPWLIAYAMKNNNVIVTYEVSRPEMKAKIKIPEPCNHFGVRFITPIEMFRELKEKF